MSQTKNILMKELEKSSVLNNAEMNEVLLLMKSFSSISFPINMKHLDLLVDLY